MWNPLKVQGINMESIYNGSESTWSPSNQCGADLQHFLKKTNVFAGVRTRVLRTHEKTTRPTTKPPGHEHM